MSEGIKEWRHETSLFGIRLTQHPHSCNFCSGPKTSTPTLVPTEELFISLFIWSTDYPYRTLVWESESVKGNFPIWQMPPVVSDTSLSVQVCIKAIFKCKLSLNILIKSTCFDPHASYIDTEPRKRHPPVTFQISCAPIHQHDVLLTLQNIQTTTLIWTTTRSWNAVRSVQKAIATIELSKQFRKIVEKF